VGSNESSVVDSCCDWVGDASALVSGSGQYSLTVMAVFVGQSRTKVSRFVKTNHPTRKERLALATLFRRNEEDPHEEQEQRTHEPN
jgi:hypothetical protein